MCCTCLYLVYTMGWHKFLENIYVSRTMYSLKHFGISCPGFLIFWVLDPLKQMNITSPWTLSPLRTFSSLNPWTLSSLKIFGHYPPRSIFRTLSSPNKFRTLSSLNKFPDVVLPENFADVVLPEIFSDVVLPENFSDIVLPEKFSDIVSPEFFLFRFFFWKILPISFNDNYL